ncbi:MAG: DUF2520 domain-containing protein [Bacteroidales bacterium]|nr:DUF2520 domain-containing protein [Bacteroidales bacterium]
MEQSKNIKIAIIGGGNVAYHLARVFTSNALKPDQILVRNKLLRESFEPFCNSVIHTLQQLNSCDILFLAVNDDAVSELSKQIKLKNTLIVHTSGSLNADAAASTDNSYGVFYPLQTFSKARFPDFNEIPVFIQAGDDNSLELLKLVAGKITKNVQLSDDHIRKSLHIAAVFVSNFSHALFALAEDFLKAETVSFAHLHPLIKETASKAVETDLYQSQTGPARRNDFRTIENHLKMLAQHPEKIEIYKILTSYIHHKYHPDKNE